MAAWITPLGIGAAAAGMLLCLYLFVTLKIELRAAERRTRNECDAAISAAGQRLECMEARLAEIEQALREFEQSACGPAPRPGMNLTTRTQVLRRRRQGEDAGQIAAALGLSRTEVELLLKVDQLGMQRV